MGNLRSRHAFSLIEVMIALVLIAVAGGMAILKIKESVQVRRVHATCDIVRGTVHLAARLAKITHGEVKVAISEEDNKFWIFIDNDLNLTTHFKTTFSKKRLLEGVVGAKILIPDFRGKSRFFSFFPWGLEEPKTELLLQFDSGKEATCPLAEYIAQAEQDTSRDAQDAYPYEVQKDEQEASQVHVD
jgi:prepilin-type N-terminal cleavage/methylation domain-containing protein